MGERRKLKELEMYLSISCKTLNVYNERNNLYTIVNGSEAINKFIKEHGDYDVIEYRKYFVSETAYIVINEEE